MADWKNTVDFSDIMNTGIEIKEAAELAVTKLRSLQKNAKFGSRCPAEIKEHILYCLESVLEEFEFVEEVDDFNCALEQLYDLADTQLYGGWPGTKFLWVNTFSK